MARPTLSVCLIAKDEEAVIGRALASVQPIADEIIVVDTGSTDDTVAIAESYGARVSRFPWCGDFSAARNAGLERASGDWILVLDADECLAPNMLDRLLVALQNDQADAYLTRIVNYQDGEAISAGAVVRLFRNRPQYRFRGRIHEQITPSIAAAGGRIVPLALEIQHYGYTPTEDARKNRRERNLRLLKMEMETARGDREADLSYFLGQEYVCLSEYGDADAAFAKAWELAPRRIPGVASAHRRVEIELLRHRVDHAWKLVRVGADTVEFRWDSQLLLARLAALEGDYQLTLRALKTLQSAPPEDFGHLPRRPAELADLEARALWEAGEREHAVTVWEKCLQKYPHNQAVASHWVQHMVALQGLGPAITRAMRAYSTVEIVSACIEALLRAGELDEAASLAVLCLDNGWLSNSIFYGALQAGYWDRIAAVTERFGLAGAVHLATAAVWFGHAEALRQALDQLTGSWQRTFRVIVAGERLPDELVWAADILMVQWAEVGCIPLLKAAAASLPDWAGGLARAGWLAYHRGMVSTGLELALQQPLAPDALEVLGLAAFENKDYESAAYFLTERTTRGPAPVRVYHKAIQALLKQSNRPLARKVLALARQDRPDSLLLLNEA